MRRFFLNEFCVCVFCSVFDVNLFSFVNYLFIFLLSILVIHFELQHILLFCIQFFFSSASALGIVVNFFFILKNTFFFISLTHYETNISLIIIYALLLSL